MNNRDMCKLYVNAGLVYERGEDYLITDETYDGLSRILLSKYSKLPKWFQKYVTEDDLFTGSAATFKNIPEKFL